MKTKKWGLLYGLIIMVLFSPSLAGLSIGQGSGDSQGNNTEEWWEPWADTNKDGRLDDNELYAWKKLEMERLDTNRDKQIDEQEKRQIWKIIPSPVTTELEQKFDANGNGWLEPEEARKLLFRRVESIFLTNGRGPIETGLEQLYDTNKDGVIDLEELKSLREDLK